MPNLSSLDLNTKKAVTCYVCKKVFDRGNDPSWYLLAHQEEKHPELGIEKGKYTSGMRGKGFTGVRR
jgi:hypothetical protein